MSPQKVALPTPEAPTPPVIGLFWWQTGPAPSLPVTANQCALEHTPAVLHMHALLLPPSHSAIWSPVLRRVARVGFPAGLSLAASLPIKPLPPFCLVSLWIAHPVSLSLSLCPPLTQTSKCVPPSLGNSSRSIGLLTHRLRPLLPLTSPHPD